MGRIGVGCRRISEIRKLKLAFDRREGGAMLEPECTCQVVGLSFSSCAKPPPRPRVNNVRLSRNEYSLAFFITRRPAVFGVTKSIP